ncbi:EamA family transporter, partial [Streptomyces sp. Wh19]|nr:EamA family transporter [Streptomyces sp. Wh19]
MKAESSAINDESIAVGPSASIDPGTSTSTSTSTDSNAATGRESHRGGLVLAGLGVFAFSLTFPATAWGLESFGPWSLVALRTLLGAVIAGGALLLGRVAPPDRRHWAGL